MLKIHQRFEIDILLRLQIIKSAKQYTKSVTGYFKLSPLKSRVVSV